MRRATQRAQHLCIVLLCMTVAVGGCVTTQLAKVNQTPQDPAAQKTPHPPPLEKVEPEPDLDKERCDYPLLALGQVPTRSNPDNTFVFNHERLKAEGDAPYVLKVDDGGFFQVLFKCTAPQFFTYTITGDAEAQPDSAVGATLPESVAVTVHLTTRGVTMRHDARFLRYHVTARLREGLRQPTGQPGTAPTGVARPAKPPKAPPGTPGGQVTSTEPQPVELFSVAFDIWVITKPEWKLGVIGGVAASSLVDSKYFIKTDDAGHKTFERDGGQDRIHTDVMALANAYYSQTYGRFINVGLAFGIGTSGTAPRFFLGPSVVLGKYFVFSPGFAVGSAMRAPVGQEIGKAPINGDNTLNTLSSHMMARPYLGIGFTWIDRKDQFAAALTSAASASGVVGSCVTSVKPGTITLKEDGTASSPITVEAADDCLWAATLERGSNGIEVKDGTKKGKGTVTLKGTVLGDKPLSDVLNVIGPLGSAPKSVKVTQAPKSCVQEIDDGAAITVLTFDGKNTTKILQVKAEANCKWTATVDPASPEFALVPSKAFTGPGPLEITPPAADNDAITAVLSVVGPEGAEPKKVTLKQPKRPVSQ